MKTNSNVRSKRKRKPNTQGDTVEETGERISKKLKRTEDPASESLNQKFISSENEIPTNHRRKNEKNKKKAQRSPEKTKPPQNDKNSQLKKISAPDVNAESPVPQENKPLTSQTKPEKKKKKGKKSHPAKSSVSESVSSDPNSSAADPVQSSDAKESSKKKKHKKKKSKNKDESKNSPSTEESSQNSNPNARCERAISYLETWKNNKKNWKFEKITQMWLFKNIFDETKIPAATFGIFLEYVVDLKGNAKNFAIEICEGVIKKKEEMPETQEEDKIFKCAYKRARSILQYLH